MQHACQHYEKSTNPYSVCDLWTMTVSNSIGREIHEFTFTIKSSLYIRCLASLISSLSLSVSLSSLSVVTWCCSPSPALAFCYSNRFFLSRRRDNSAQLGIPYGLYNICTRLAGCWEKGHSRMVRVLLHKCVKWPIQLVCIDL